MNQKDDKEQPSIKVVSHHCHDDDDVDDDDDVKKDEMTCVEEHSEASPRTTTQEAVWREAAVVPAIVSHPLPRRTLPPPTPRQTRITIYMEENEPSFCTFRGCCSCPHGPILVVALVLTMAALSLTGNAMKSCTFLKSNMLRILGSDDDNNDNSLDGYYYEYQKYVYGYKIGILQYQDMSDTSTTTAYESEPECVTWNDGVLKESVYDETWVTARVVTLLASLSGTVSVIILCLATCFSCPTQGFPRLSLLFLIISLCFIVSFVVFASDACELDGCVMDRGATLMMLGIVCWAAASAAVLSVPPPRSRGQGSSRQTRPMYPLPRVIQWRQRWLGTLIVCWALGSLLVGLVIGLRDITDDDDNKRTEIQVALWLHAHSVRDALERRTAAG